MRHGIAGRKFGRTSAHRKAMFCNLVTELVRHEQISTTLPKAKDLRRVVEPIITKAREDSVAARREVAKVIKDADVLRKLFTEIAPRFKETQGGYTRVLKAGFRQGDCAPMAIIALTEGKAPTAKPKAKKAAAKPEAKAAEPKAEEKVEASAPETSADTAEKPAEEAKSE
ncbi:MAG: 50S ribosomal protein L17 [Alphaproteobacteria bacterium]|nr:50S ribosomal protein L17 [Alphaproteobacteria bacterium]MDD9919533.1 50S ribosomal protein L17 [Alphaproteobacteria bacterium]